MDISKQEEVTKTKVMEEEEVDTTIKGKEEMDLRKVQRDLRDNLVLWTH